MPERVHYIDWLRVLAGLMLVPFHTAMAFAPWPWYLRSDELNLAAMAFIAVLDQYHM